MNFQIFQWVSLPYNYIFHSHLWACFCEQTSRFQFLLLIMKTLHCISFFLNTFGHTWGQQSDEKGGGLNKIQNSISERGLNNRVRLVNLAKIEICPSPSPCNKYLGVKKLFQILKKPFEIKVSICSVVLLISVNLVELAENLTGRQLNNWHIFLKSFFVSC